MRPTWIALILILIAVPAFAELPDSTLDTPEVVKAPVVTYRLQGIYIGRGPTIKANYNKLDVSGNIIEQVTCVLEGSDLIARYTATIGAGQVGDAYVDVLSRAIESTCSGADYLNYSGISN